MRLNTLDIQVRTICIKNIPWNGKRQPKTRVIFKIISYLLTPYPDPHKGNIIFIGTAKHCQNKNRTHSTLACTS